MLSMFAVTMPLKLSKTTDQKMLSTTESTRENIRAINEYWIVTAARIHLHKHVNTCLLHCDCVVFCIVATVVVVMVVVKVVYVSV